MERASLGVVVKPIWLLTTKWIVPAHGVPFELAQVQGLRHEPLAREGRVPVDEEGEHLPAVLHVVPLALLGAGPAQDHRVHRLQVAGVAREGDVEKPSRGDSRWSEV